MKKLITLIAVLASIATTVISQTPEKISYQAVVRDASNNLLKDQNVGIQISIIQGTVDGTAVYSETQTVTSNTSGLIAIEIGTGNSSDDFSSIDWSNGTHFIKTEIDPNGATNYTITGISQLLSVPYALHAKTAESIDGLDKLAAIFSKSGIEMISADFATTETMISVNSPTTFNDLSFNAETWKWNFGDGNFSTEQNPTHTYTIPGCYTVTLETNNSLASTSISKKDCILAVSDENIAIDNNSVFNMKNFITSFEQMFVNDNRWAWDFTQNYTGERITETYQNYKIYGDIGDKIFTITHIYNNDGVITSSNRSTNDYFSSKPTTFRYTYDENGYIKYLTKVRDNSVRDSVLLEFNNNEQLVKITHLALDDEEDDFSYSFEYNAAGQVTKYYTEDQSYEYTYQGNDMVQVLCLERDDEFNDEWDIEYYEYDNEGRIVKDYQESRNDEDNTNFCIYSYTTDQMIVDDYYSIDDHRDRCFYGPQYTVILDMEVFFKDGAYSYGRERVEDDDHNKIIETYIYEGTLATPVLMGYSIINSIKDNYYVEQETIYNAQKSKLYDVTYTYDEISITSITVTSAQGDSVSIDNLDEWVKHAMFRSSF